MEIKLNKAMIDAVTLAKLKPFGVKEDEIRSWKPEVMMDLARYSPKQLGALLDLFTPHAKVKGFQPVIKDCQAWLKAITGDKSVKARSVRHFESLLRLYISKDKDKWLYQQDGDRGVWWPYYVSKLEYHPATSRGENYSPPYVSVSMVYREFGGTDSHGLNFGPDDCLGITVEEAVARKGYMLQTPALREEYDRRHSMFLACANKIGKQYLCTGMATDNVDGNRESDDDRWYYRRTNTIQMEKDGVGSRVVIDLFYESEKSARDRSTSIDRGYWYKSAPKTSDKYDDITIEEDEDGEERPVREKTGEAVDFDSMPLPDVPLHPMVAVFDLKRQVRLRVDVGQLTEYKYDSKLGDKLVLPEDSRHLVEMLLAHKGGFQDIVSGKSGGAVIMCAGTPGTGKTLTAEVYAEVMARPLYSVQASQLGLTPDDLEGALLKVFARASRWGAILLLDEADVYVTQRGADLQQNAIVGVFLRVLEYYKGVMFMTTNRSDLVDDAIASRCVARIDYGAPHPDDQKRIWRILADSSGTAISDEVISEVVARYPDLTGRDVKNLLKLAKLVSDSRDCDINLDVIRFVKRFKPTIDHGKPVMEEPVRLPPLKVVAPAEAATEEQPLAAPATPEAQAGSEGGEERGWRYVASEVFADGAPHSVAEVKEAVREVDGSVHPNAVTTLMVSLAKAGTLTRLPSGLYQRVSA